MKTLTALLIGLFPLHLLAQTVVPESDIPSLLKQAEAYADAEDFESSQQRMSACGSGNQLDQNECMAAQFVKLDGQLNRLYKQLVTSLESPSRLKKAQVAWIKFRDTTCEYETSGISEGGSMLPFARNTCLADLTAKRIQDLQRYIEEDCNGCPPKK